MPFVAGRTAELGRDRPGPHRRVHPGPDGPALGQAGPGRRRLGRRPSAVEELTDLDRRWRKVGWSAGWSSWIPSTAAVTPASASRGIRPAPTRTDPAARSWTATCLFDLEARFISYVSLKGTHHLLSKEGKVLGNLTGRFVLTRQVRRHGARS